MSEMIKQWAWGEQRRGQGGPLHGCASQRRAELPAANSRETSSGKPGCGNRFLGNMMTGNALRRRV